MTTTAWFWRCVAGTLGCAVIAIATAQPAKPLYENDFSNAAPGSLPPDFLVIDGLFAVQQDGTNRFLELPGAPLDTFGVLFGPTVKENVTVSARVFGTSKGRKHPTFGVSLNGSRGYQLRVSPAKRSIELLKDDQVLSSAAFVWESAHWTHLRLQIRKLAAGSWKIEGKAWPQDGGNSKEPEGWTISAEDKGEPASGRPGIWGSPFSGEPIRFDDLFVNSIEDVR